MGGPEYNPADDEPIDREEWEAYEEKQSRQGSTFNCLQCGKPIQYRKGTCPHCGYKEF